MVWTRRRWRWRCSGDGGEIATVQVGKRDGATAYVATGAQPAIYAGGGADPGRDAKVPDDFKG